MISIPVGDTSQVGDARRRVRVLTEQHGWPEFDAGRASLLVTELATNIVKHAGRGEILAVLDDEGLGVLALDRGEGMAHPEACGVDGYSTAGTLGHGLGAIRRQSDAVSIASWPGRGTAVLARIRSPSRRGQDAEAPTLGAVVVAAPSEEACGDAWSAQVEEGVTSILVIDGLGHGVDAALAAHAGVVEFRRVPGRSPERCVEDLHGALRAHPRRCARGRTGRPCQPPPSPSSAWATSLPPTSGCDGRVQAHGLAQRDRRPQRCAKSSPSTIHAAPVGW